MYLMERYKIFTIYMYTNYFYIIRNKYEMINIKVFLYYITAYHVLM